MLNFSADDGDKIRLRGTNDESKLGLSGTGGLSLSYYAGNLNQPKTGQHIFNVSKTGSNGWIDRLRINSMGDGNNAAVFFNRDASNSCTVVTGTGWSCSSDERLKKDIAPISDGLSIVQALRSVTFLWKDGDSGLQSGFIAQDVEKVLPQLVSTDANGYKTLSQNGIVPYLVNAIQSQQEEIDTLKQAQQEQQQQIDELRASIRNIQR
jgi:hypothetical protein